MAERVLTRRELNRALLARQMLLERAPAGVPNAVERLGGLQAQYSPSPYLSLHARLEGFERAELTSALERRRVVKALLQRGTLHIVTPRDFWAFTAARRALAADYWPPAYERLLPKRRIAEIASATAAALRSAPLTFEEVRELLRPFASERISTTFLWRRVQGQAAVVHVAPSGTWGYHGDGVFVAADAVLRGGLPDPADAREHLLRSYLRAFGPASAHDVAQWAGLQRTGPITETITGMSLRTFRDERGKVLYDLPRAPLPDPETPVPPRLVPRYDNLVLSHADRTRILGEVPVARIVTKNALVHATILVDGFAAGTWQLEKGRVRLEPFSRLSRATMAALRAEAERVEGFVEP
ncbi:MAG TPA: winged helix DNA-binding domain-containing protein, partial [Gaiellaceae bacterium]|nr:winged helix DNA-binding domain-containing protein [Gaiellaceae bacterium]